MLLIVLLCLLGYLARKYYRHKEEGSRFYQPSEEKQVENTQTNGVTNSGFDVDPGNAVTGSDGGNGNAVTVQPEGLSHIPVPTPTMDVQWSVI